MTEVERFFLACLRFSFQRIGSSSSREVISPFFSEGFEGFQRYMRNGMEVQRGEKEPDRDLFLAWAQWHGVAPLVYHSLREVKWTGIPDRVREGLEKDFRENMARNLFLAAETDKVLEILGKRDVAGIPIKGTSLSEEVYPDISYRIATDIDILIQRKDLKIAEKALLEAGYHLDPFVKNGSFPENCYTLHLEKGEHRGRKSCVELHWNLATSRDYKIRIESWWERILCNAGRNGSAGNGAKSLRMGPELTLLYLTINAHMSRYLFLKQLVDIARVVKYYEGRIDWEDVLDMAMEVGVADNLIFALGLVHKLFGIRIWDGFAGRSGSRKQRIFQFIFTEQRLIKGAMGQDLRHFLLLFLFDKKRQMAKSIWEVLFPSKAAVAYRYNLAPLSKSIYLYWFLNPVFSVYRLIRGKYVNCWAGKGIGDRCG